MISPSLIEHIFKAASISRWNDYPKMVDLTELDKQAHKFIIAYFIAKFEKNVDMNFIIEGALFEFFSRVVVTDIRPDVYHEIIKNKKNEMNKWILDKIEPLIENIDDGKFLDKFKDYQLGIGHEKERLIIRAASYLATRWEFSIVYQTSQFLNDIESLKAKVDEELEDYYELIGVRKISLNKKLAKLVDLSGRLRFQKRWAQTQRIPATNVLGHMLVVAIFGYFYSLKVKACPKRIENNFFCALFHDLPESLTRDIISPVKYGVNGLDEIISEYEMRLIDEKILPLVPLKFKKEFAYLLGVRKDINPAKKIEHLIENDKKNEFNEILGDLVNFQIYIKNEFENRILNNLGEPEPYEGSMNSLAINNEKNSPIDGKALKYCDKLAAYIEAGISISYGVKSKEIVNGFKSIDSFFKEKPNIEGINFYSICEKLKEYFDIETFPQMTAAHI